MSQMGCSLKCEDPMDKNSYSSQKPWDDSAVFERTNSGVKCCGEIQRDMNASASLPTIKYKACPSANLYSGLKLFVVGFSI